MKLYTSRGAPNPRRVMWVMAEKAIEDIEVVELDLLKGEHRGAERTARAGADHLPALEFDDGQVLTESIAICRYLEFLHPDPNLFGVGALETAIVEMWMRRAELLLATPLMLAVRHSHPALAVLEPQIAEIAAFNRAAAERAVATFEQRLTASPFLAGERPTIADIVAAVGLDFARMAQFAIPDDAPSLKRWSEAMRARPAAKASRRA